MDARDREEYELALKIGKQRFASSCPHGKVKNGRCCQCLGKVYQPGSKQSFKTPVDKAF